MIYDYECDKCGAETSLHRSVAERDNPAKCEHCELGMYKRLAVPKEANPIKVKGASYKNGYKVTK